MACHGGVFAPGNGQFQVFSKPTGKLATATGNPIPRIFRKHFPMLRHLASAASDSSPVPADTAPQEFGVRCTRRRSQRRCIVTMLVLMLVSFFAATSWSASSWSRSTWDASTVEQAESGRHPFRPEGGWRRTIRGWERTEAWRWSPAELRTAPGAAVHPLVVASLQLLLTTAALISASPDLSNQGSPGLIVKSRT